MPYAHPEYQPPYRHGSYAAPQQMTTSLNLHQEVASSRQCQVPWACNCMHPSMSLEAQTHRSMPANWGTRYVPQPSHLSCDDSSESKRDVRSDGDPDSDRHSKEETPCPNSGGISKLHAPFRKPSTGFRPSRRARSPTLILSCFDTMPVSRHRPLDRPSAQHAVDFGIGPLSPSSLSSHRSTRLFRPFRFPPLEHPD